MRRAFAVVIIIGSIVALWGCGGSDSPEAAKPTAELFPFTQGNSWQYLVEDYSTNTSAAVQLMRQRTERRSLGFFGIEDRVNSSQADEPAVAELFMTCTGEVPADSSVWYEIGMSQNGESKGALYLKHDPEGLLAATNDSYFENGEFVVVDAYHRLRTPLEAGNEWEHQFVDAVGPYTVTFRIDGVGVSQTVEADSFENCVKTEEIQESGGNVYRVATWFAPDVGIILSEEYVDDELTGRTELWSYYVQ